MLGALSSSLYKDNTFLAVFQIAFTGEYHSEMLKCSDLQQTGFGVCYITRRAPTVGIRLRAGWAQRMEYPWISLQGLIYRYIFHFR